MGLGFKGRPCCYGVCLLSEMRAACLVVGSPAPQCVGAGHTELVSVALRVSSGFLSNYCSKPVRPWVSSQRQWGLWPLLWFPLEPLPLLFTQERLRPVPEGHGALGGAGGILSLSVWLDLECKLEGFPALPNSHTQVDSVLAFPQRHSRLVRVYAASLRKPDLGPCAQQHRAGTLKGIRTLPPGLWAVAEKDR